MKQFLYNYKQLTQETKSLLYFNWIYSVWVLVWAVFVNVYVFSVNQSLFDSIVYNLVFFSGSFLGFWVSGFIISHYKKDIKLLYILAYSLFIVSFVPVAFVWKDMWAIYFMALSYSLGNWIFWCALHSHELSSIPDSQRDFYSGSIGAGRNILAIVVPVIVTLCIYIWNVFAFDGFRIVFALLPCIYLWSFLFIKWVWSFIPPAISLKSVMKILYTKKLMYGNIFFLLDGFILGCLVLAIALANITLLTSEFQVGVFQSVISCISVFLLAYLWLKLKVENRLKGHRFVTILMCLNLLVFSLNFTPLGLIIFALWELLIAPMIKMINRVFSMRLMDNWWSGGQDFFAPMLSREVVLWFGRILWLLFAYSLHYTLHLDIHTTLSLIFFTAAWVFWLQHLILFLWNKYEKI